MQQDEKMTFLANSIAKAKRVMEKVDAGNYTRNHINPDLIISNNEALVNEIHAPSNQMIPEQPQLLKNAGTSKLPTEILESFKNNPGTIAAGMGKIDTSNPLGITSFQMNQLASTVKQVQGVQQPKPKARHQVQTENDNALGARYQKMLEAKYTSQPSLTHQVVAPTAAPISEDYLNFLINKVVENTVKKTVELVLEQLNTQTTLDENIEIKIGGKKFGGKISSLKEQVKK